MARVVGSSLEFPSRVVLVFGMIGCSVGVGVGEGWMV